ncbi:uncharacterized protein LOC124146311 isoform X2 [Haliotis rufescens]|uniref:uncharacterized protein LOC124146311 isoform X2 n=1 Tax=Haliotis rufescens TaxID=6454 RepID=UPI001EAFDFA9|nr:uncharacterized protein LOC124146311 isoform X2 [Haliotis rufescens]
MWDQIIRGWERMYGYFFTRRVVPEFDESSVDLFVKVKEINKRTLGKLVIATVGHEGQENNKAEEVLRRQIQTCISKVPNYSPETWKDARVSFICRDGKVFVIQSGCGRMQFMVRLDGKDRIKFVDFN